MDNQPEINAHPTVTSPIHWMDMESNQSHNQNARRQKKENHQLPNQKEQIILKKIYSQNSKSSKIDRILNKTKVRQGWNDLIQLTSKLRKDLSWQLSNLRGNKPQIFQVIPPQALIVIDVSRRGCEATLLLNSNKIEFKSGGIWKKSWILKSSNQI
ncbi:MAG: hypothetical protein EZS28_047411, partial [Streblomastix strix]